MNDEWFVQCAYLGVMCPSSRCQYLSIGTICSELTARILPPSSACSECRCLICQLAISALILLPSAFPGSLLGLLMSLSSGKPYIWSFPQMKAFNRRWKGVRMRACCTETCTATSTSTATSTAFSIVTPYFYRSLENH